MPQKIFITGVSSGLGHGLAKRYLERGDAVFGCSRREPEDLTAHERFQFIACDLAECDSIPQQLDPLLKEMDSCDLAILNAGMLSTFGDMQSASLEECRRVMDVNVWANKALLDCLLPKYPAMKQVVTISSGAAVNGNRGWNAYSISKAALNMLTKLYSEEAKETHFVAVAPGLIDTHMQDVLCNLPEDDRFPALEKLRSRQGTDEMPSGDELAPRMIQTIESAPQNVESGEFIDIRKIDW